MVYGNIPYDIRKELFLRGSPLYNLKNSALSSGGQDIADFETSVPKAAKYLPFNFLMITNTGEDEITVWFDSALDSTEGKVIPKGAILTFQNIWYRRIIYKNTGTTSITANYIEFAGKLMPQSEEYAKSYVQGGIPIIERLKLLMGL